MCFEYSGKQGHLGWHRFEHGGGTARVKLGEALLAIVRTLAFTQ